MATLTRASFRSFRNAGFAKGRLERRGSVLQGCLIALGVVLLIVVAIVIYVAVSWKGWVASGLKAVTQQAVASSELPEDQKTRIIARVDLLADDFKNGKVSGDQLGRILTNVAEGPLLPLGMVYAAQKKHVEPSGLSKEEKEAATRSLQRFAKGVADQKISKQELKAVVDSISEVGPNGQNELKKKLTDAEVRTLAELAKSKADAASMPDEAFAVDVAGEIEKSIDKALGK